MPPSRSAIALGAALALLIPAFAGTPATAAPRPDPRDRFTRIEAPKKVETSFTPLAASPDAKVQVMVELTDDPVAVVQAKTGRVLNTAEKAKIRSALKAKQDGLKSTIKARGGQVESQMQSAFNGMRVRIARTKVDGLRGLPGVKSVTGVPVRKLTNAVSVPYLGVPQVWANNGYTGKGIKVAIIDTGIDYTHADFGGPGTEAAYAAAHADEAGTPDPALFGPAAPRVKGGYDFVGDAYDANDPDSFPMPDANPLDCNGHGTHVAGTTGGSGVLEDGATYPGPYDTTTHSNTFKVGPGVAPEVDLYAYKVFGCSGSTSVATEAIDRAVKDDVDVINMSLGSVYGRAADSDSIAASNAVAAGVVVVASAGNDGPNPYLVGSPSVGRGVISVAANDSTESFPGAKLTFADGSTMDAINANGVDPLPAGPYTVKVIVDDPTTDENEALGCSAAAFGTVTATDIAVVQRGTCARVAKAIFGQQAGGGAVVMVNNTNGYPPYEGPITSNPDDGTPYTVTIPFLGVRKSDGAALEAQNGEAVTLSAMQLANPAFSAAASFSSGGPRTADSGAKPDLVAPGVSIASAGVGTGSGAEVLSGTSMAAPHAAGVAALAVQAHPKWTAAQVSAAMVTTSDPDEVAGYRLTLTGAGLVDVNQVVNTSTYALGDAYKQAGKTGNEASLSFGFTEIGSSYSGVRKITVVNKGTSTVTYKVSATPTEQSLRGKVTVSPSKVTVRPGRTATVTVRLTVSASAVPSSMQLAATDTQWQFFEVSGNITLTPTSGDKLRVRYLLVPRSLSSVSGKASWAKSGTAATVTLKNSRMSTYADFYTWGLEDGKDVRLSTSVLSGMDLRAAGVQSFADGDDHLLVFAVNNWTRWSNAAALEFDVEVDKNSDGSADAVVFAADYGLVATDNPDGRMGVFIYDIKSKDTYFSGFLATSPTDSSTLLLPVVASDIDGALASRPFQYKVSSSDVVNALATDEFNLWAKYDLGTKAVADGDFVEVRKGKTVKVPVALDPTQLAALKPLGIMVVALDNSSGSSEAILLRK